MMPLDGPSRDAAPPPEGSGVAKTPAAPFWPPAAAVLRLPLPEIAKKHDDLEAIKKAVEDAASVSGPLWLSYLFALFYIALAAAGVTHADLLLENPVKLPFLNIELALKAFFVLAPILFVILHAYTMMYFVLLGAKASQFHDRLYEQIPHDEKIREGLRRQLPSNIFVQFLAGPREFREGAFGWLLKIIAWTTLVVFPMALLLLLQLQFLPYHDFAITWTSRVVILVDYLLIGWLWPSVLGGRTGLLEGWRWWVGLKPQSAMALLGLLTVIFSWGVATFPGEWEDVPSSLPPVSSLKAATNSVTDRIFGGAIGDETAWRWPTNKLRLKSFDIYEALKTEPEKIRWKKHSFELQQRHLEYADLSWARLDNVDLDHAQLQGASLAFAQLQGASLAFAQLQGASLDHAQLQRASLYRAELQGASLDSARLQGASLDHAQLQGALLYRAQLQGASLDSANLPGARLEYAQLQGALLDGALLEGASLDYARLQGASLGTAVLEGASLEYAQLQGASLDGALLEGASLDYAQLQGASFDGAVLQPASLTGVLVWRSHWSGLELIDLGQNLGELAWLPVWRDMKNFEIHPWNDQSYGELRKMLEEIPEGDNRKAALERIERLDCLQSKRNGESLASCNPKAKPPAEAAAWRSILEIGPAPDHATYRRSLAGVFSSLICVGGADRIHVLRGLAVTDHQPLQLMIGAATENLPKGHGPRLEELGGEALELIDKSSRATTALSPPR